MNYLSLRAMPSKTDHSDVKKSPCSTPWALSDLAFSTHKPKVTGTSKVTFDVIFGFPVAENTWVPNMSHSTAYIVEIHNFKYHVRVMTFILCKSENEGYDVYTLDCSTVLKIESSIPARNRC